MEYALWDGMSTKRAQTEISVLILVLMEYALWAPDVKTYAVGLAGLNPCFNGICSLSITM